jgi:hypothetical protein
MATTFAPFAAQADESDFGIQVEKLLKEQSEKLFGVEKPLGASAPATVGAYRTPSQSAYDQVLAANGLKLEYLTREAANATDMMAFYPAQNPTHLVTCIEGGRQFLIDGGTPACTTPATSSTVGAAHQLATGAVETILRACRPATASAPPRGAILATEERTDGGACEIFNPLGVSEQTVIDRASGAVTDPANITKRTALPTIAWEGIAVLPNGVVIAGDELRPGSPANADGGAIFKFVPAMPRLVAGPIANLSESPLAAASVYAMQVSCVSNTQQYGQGCEIGNAAWVAVNAATARTDANTAGATGYYRPEDLHQDPMYKDEANPEAVRFCWTNTGNEDGKNYAEIMCGVDSAPLTANNTQRSVAVNRFVEGDTDFNSFDNLEFQPKTGNVYVIEDHDNGDIFACLPDGMDRDIKTDGCVKILSVKDSSLNQQASLRCFRHDCLRLDPAQRRHQYAAGRWLSDG